MQEIGRKLFAVGFIVLFVLPSIWFAGRLLWTLFTAGFDAVAELPPWQNLWGVAATVFGLFSILNRGS